MISRTDPMIKEVAEVYYALYFRPLYPYMLVNYTTNQG